MEAIRHLSKASVLSSIRDKGNVLRMHQYCKVHEQKDIFVFRQKKLDN